MQDFAEGNSGARAHEKIIVRHEPRRDRDFGTPDFLILRRGGILGYVEVKGVGTDLRKLANSEQITRYRNLSQNILLTDYVSWLWLGDGDDVKSSTVLCTPAQFDDRKFRPSTAALDEVAQQLEGFFSVAPRGVGRASELAKALAVRCKPLSRMLTNKLQRQPEVRLFGLYKSFREQISERLQLEEFADAYAQTLGYGLLLARLQANKRKGSRAKLLTLDNAKEFIPDSFGLLQELMDFLPDLEHEKYGSMRWIVEEILSIVNHMDVVGVHEDLAFRNRKEAYRGLRELDKEEWELFSRDPFVYFYEDFLTSYDENLRRQRGVYYTPPPVVRFIVRSTDSLLRKKVGIHDGLANSKRVKVLDFATGTGAFLLEIFRQIFESVGGEDNPKAELILHEHIIKNIYGFEYLLVPYVIAHLKLAYFLEDMGHELRKKERLGVYMTNTLEKMKPQINWLLPAMTMEGKEAHKVKKKELLVITGNPPYAGHSMNTSSEIRESIKVYKSIDGKPLDERNLKWLQDDYVKFLRFAQMKMDQVDEGIVAVITNHAWMDNPTFRGMRYSLMQSFQQIYVLDLHGNARRKEQTPEGGIDQNVFDIQQGVAISFFIKKDGLERGIFHADLWGERLDKYNWLARKNFESVEWKQLEPVKPFYLFIPQDREMWEKYEKGLQIKNIFIQNSIGIVTARDDLNIHMNKKELMETLRDFSSLDVEKARQKYKLGKDVRDWKVSWAQQDVKDSDCDEEKAHPILYRPFDRRWTYYTGKSRGLMCYPRHGVMRHMLKDRSQGNIALGCVRQAKGDDSGIWQHCMVTDTIAEISFISSQVSYLFPAYIYAPEEGEKVNKNILNLFPERDPFQNAERIENLSPNFRKWLDERYASPSISVEDIIGYIYAVLNAPSYQRRFTEFLKIDFPRIPFPEKRKHLEDLSIWGNKLIHAHLLREFPKHKNLLQGRGSKIIGKPKHDPSENKLFISEDLFFTCVTTEIWQFQIGGYKILEKYLRERRGRTLSLEETQTLERIIYSIGFSINAATKVDELWNEAFPKAFLHEAGVRID